MSDQHCEEQEMEAEALTAIFDTSFEILKNEQPFEWCVKLVPIDCGGDVEEEEIQNHVAVKVLATIPLDYPEISLPTLDIEIIKGLADEHKEELIELANTEAKANEGMPVIFAVCESIREWLNNNNVKGLNDSSMYAQMMRKEKEAERTKALAERNYETQKKEESEMTQAEIEELQVRKRREEGTPCTKENFELWNEKFQKEMIENEAKEKEQAEKDATSNKKGKGGGGEKIVDKSDRTTGFDQFSGKVGVLDIEAIEKAAAEEEERPPDDDDDEDLDVDEELFDDDDDLDDLDFDDDDDEFDDDDDEEEQPDI